MPSTSVQQECLTRVFQSIVRETGRERERERECVCVFYQSVPQECRARVSGKSVSQECPIKVSRKSAPQECATRGSQKSVPHDCPRRVSSKSVLQERLLMRSSISCSLFIVL